jgi:hemerythrin-like metal-binding protein
MAKQRTRFVDPVDSIMNICEQASQERDEKQTRRADDLLGASPQIEREHLELQAAGIAFSAAVVAGASRAELFIRATWLLEDFQRHFDSEEGLMRSNSFPGLKPHIDEHRKLIEQMSGLRDDIGSGVVNRCDALAVFVRLWAEQHMAGPDAHFARFLDEEKARYGANLYFAEQ